MRQIQGLAGPSAVPKPGCDFWLKGPVQGCTDLVYTAGDPPQLCLTGNLWEQDCGGLIQRALRPVPFGTQFGFQGNHIN